MGYFRKCQVIVLGVDKNVETLSTEKSDEKRDSITHPSPQTVHGELDPGGLKWCFGTKF